jgi:hypothetical protein
MKRFLRIVACLGLGCALVAGCQKKTETTTETSKTVEAPPARPDATPVVSETQTTTTTSTSTTAPTPVPTRAR